MPIVISLPTLVPSPVSVPAASALHVVLLEGIDPSAASTFREAGFASVTCLAHAPTGAALADALQGAHLLGVRSGTQLTEAVLQSAPSLLGIGCFCIGTNQVDLPAATRLGVPVFNAPFSNTRSVAELVLAHIIYLLRGIPLRNADLHRGLWVKSAEASYEVRGKTLGLVGYGHIGSQVGVLAEQLGMVVLFVDTEAKLPFGNAKEVANLPALLAQADVVSLHVPQTLETQGMFGAEQIAQMKPGSHLINASRGTVVDIDALAVALDTQHLHGAAVDVFPQEPRGNETGFDSPLTRFDNVVLTPHIAGSTREAQANIGKEVATKLVRYALNGSTIAAVNFPKVALPAQAGRKRLLHIHHNTPGVLAQLNALLSAAGANIAAQYLSTHGEMGYVVVDVEGAADLPALDRLCAIPGTVRCRWV